MAPDDTAERTEGVSYYYLVTGGIADESVVYATHEEASAAADRRTGQTGSLHAVGVSVHGGHHFQFGHRWIDDAQSRDLDIGLEISRTRTTATLIMTFEQWQEALSAARYDDEVLGEYSQHRLLAQAAKRVIKKLTSSPPAPREWLGRI